MAEQQQDVDTLRRRGRRRLIGAVALVLLAVVVLPMVFDPEPRPPVPAVSVRIPGEDEAPFKPKPSAPAGKPAPRVDKPAAPVPSGEQYVVPVGAFSNPEGVIAKLTAAKLPYYTEPAKGALTRVRAGPFESKEAAQKAADRLRSLGLTPGNVTPKSG